ncbi:MAG: 4Fe-4S binding protein [Candidatus Margulisbacteria bacterium]|nr:4Fe-4S binding protein [Candidatus Margulisiibacteriota bacterium]
MGHPVNHEDLKKGGMVKLKDKDMFSVWVRAVCDNMGADKLRKVAELAGKYGRGLVLFTSRQFPIIPHVHLDDLGKVQAELRQVELMLDHCGARVRNADVCYDANLCPYAVMDPISLGEKLDQFWRDDQGGFKIKTSIAGCERQCTAPRVLGDIGFVGAERNGQKGYDAYVGGKLGLDPFLGIKMAELISEEAALNLVKNYVGFIRQEGREGERAAALIRRLGEKIVRTALTKDLDAGNETKPFPCDTKQPRKADGDILRVRATNGEATTAEVLKIADIAKKYGLGFVHFPVRGGPEIPGVDISHVQAIRDELRAAGLSLIESGIDNLQSCFGGYCDNGLFDAQELVRKVEKLVEKIGLNNLNIKISASGCPNSCGISHLSDIGFVGVVEPEVDLNKCKGCGVCLKACRTRSLAVENKRAVYDRGKCKNCGMCIKACPFGALFAKRKGITILAGGIGPHFFNDDQQGETRLGEKLIGFVDEAGALAITEKILLLVKRTGKTIAGLMSELGFDKFKEAVL